jgi:hypothetical protein
VLADIVSGRRTEIESADLGFARYAKGRARGATGPLVPVAG